MATKIVTIKRTFTRLELIGKHHATGRAVPFNEVNSANHLITELHKVGIPVVGVMGVLAPEWGLLTITHEDGLDGDEWTYAWSGEQVPRDWREKLAKVGYRSRLDKPLRKQIDDEL